jgi:hypothetical protein
MLGGLQMNVASHLFIGGVPATGKTWLGNWLAAERGYLHIDAEVQNGTDFDKVDAHREWDELINTGHAKGFLDAVERLVKPVVLNWGLPTRYLYVVAVLQEQGFQAWWLHGDRSQARTAFLARGGIDVRCFDTQMNDIEREWSLIKLVFGSRIVSGLKTDGSQRRPQDLWSEICRLTTACSRWRRRDRERRG